MHDVQYLKDDLCFLHTKSQFIANLIAWVDGMRIRADCK